MSSQSAVENSVSTYVCYAPDGLFWLNLYLGETCRQHHALNILLKARVCPHTNLIESLEFWQIVEKSAIIRVWHKAILRLPSGLY